MRRPWVKLILAISLDGRLALASGGKATIGGRGDRRALEESLAWADGVLIGGKTIRIHRNTCLIHDEELIKKRLIDKRPPQPIAIVVSKKQDFNNNLPFFKQPIKRWIIAPYPQDEVSLKRVGFEKIISLNEDWSKNLEKLFNRGVTRIALLGGAKLIYSLLCSDQVDELQLTLTPKILGGIYTWVPEGANQLPEVFETGKAWDFNNYKKLEGNELVLKYLRNRREKSK